MGYIINKIKFIMTADEIVSENNERGEWRTISGITLITSASYLLMSIMNIIQDSVNMLWMTGASSLALLVIFLIGYGLHNIKFLKTLYLIINMVVLTTFVVWGGNNGFAALWLIVTPFVAMFLIDLRRGFLVGIYFTVMLIVVLVSPVNQYIDYDYGIMFRLRFPCLFLVAFALASFIVIRGRLFQFELIVQRKEIERISSMDMTTGLFNRNQFNNFCNSYNEILTEKLTAVFIDANGLHALNNSKGHAAGDRMLKKIADECVNVFSKNAVYRLGGDEFLILTDRLDTEGIKLDMKTIDINLNKSGYSISYGIAAMKEGRNLPDTVKEADRLMLENKELYYEKNNIEHR